MNFLVGLLLVAVEHDSERCFWLLLVLLEKVRGREGGRKEGGVQHLHGACVCVCAGAAQTHVVGCVSFVPVWLMVM